VPVVVRRVVVAVRKVPSTPVVDVAVAVVVDAVRPAPCAILAVVDPHVLGEVGVRRVHAGVDDGDDDVGATGGDRPRLRGVDVGIRRARGVVHRLADVVQAPEPREEGVVRRHVGGVKDEVRLGVGDPGVSPERSHRLGRSLR
jgi:hypothetical protein